DHLDARRAERYQDRNSDSGNTARTLRRLIVFRASCFMRRLKRGFSIIEATVALAAFSGISAFVFSLAITTNREANRSLVSLPADMNTFRLMEQARYKLMPAQTGRITLVSPNEIRYTDASTGKKVVLLWDNGEENTEMRGLWFQE